MNDVITLPSYKELAPRLAISIATSQSVKLHRCEHLIDEYIEKYQVYPHEIATYGSANMTRNETQCAVVDIYKVFVFISLYFPY